jgi:hypothetical protein
MHCTEGGVGTGLVCSFGLSGFGGEVWWGIFGRVELGRSPTVRTNKQSPALHYVLTLPKSTLVLISQVHRLTSFVLSIILRNYTWVQEVSDLYAKSIS